VATDRTKRTGTVFDIGYQSYRGEREGRGRAWQTIFLDGVKNGMGIGRGGWAKFLPWLVLSPTIITGLVFAGIAAFFEQIGIEGDIGEGTSSVDLPGHQDLTSVIAFLLLIFAAFVGPELVCPDRRNRVIHLYFVRPITLIDYLGSRWCALVVLLLVTGLLPHLTLWIGLLFGVSDAVGHLQDNWVDIPRFIGNSTVFAVFAASFTFAVSSLTDRRMIATLIAIGIIMISSLVPAIVEIFDPSENVENFVALVGLIDLNSNIIPSIFFAAYEDNYDLNMSFPIAWMVLLTAGFILATWRFYKAQR
jgi:ABC-2 type transport system permease protein